MTPYILHMKLNINRHQHFHEMILHLLNKVQIFWKDLKIGRFFTCFVAFSEYHDFTIILWMFPKYLEKTQMNIFWKCDYKMDLPLNGTKVKQASIFRVEINYLIPYSSSKNSPLLKRTPFKTHYVHFSLSQVHQIKWVLHLSFKLYFRLCISFFIHFFLD
jgi:hypothetical protein